MEEYQEDWDPLRDLTREQIRLKRDAEEQKKAEARHKRLCLMANEERPIVYIDYLYSDPFDNFKTEYPAFTLRNIKSLFENHGFIISNDHITAKFIVCCISLQLWNIQLNKQNGLSEMYKRISTMWNFNKVCILVCINSNDATGTYYNADNITPTSPLLKMHVAVYFEPLQEIRIKTNKGMLDPDNILK
jgi:hypothetical protein